MALGLVAIVVATMFMAAAAMKPSKADAWAWKDNCTAIIYNRTGSQSSVHPFTYIPILPNPGSIAAFAAYAAIGIPVNQALPLVNSGYPVPSYGCHAIVTTTSPQGATSCAYSAPTTGANHFDCSSNVSFKIIDDSDDIAANVFIPAGSGASSPPVTGPKARKGPPALRPRAIPGKGWRSTNKVHHLGLIGKLMNQGDTTASCEHGANHTPTAINSVQFIKGKSTRGVGALRGRFADKHDAHQTVADALSKHSMHCLSRLLTSRTLHTHAHAKPLEIAREGVDVRGSEVVVHRRVHGEQRNAAYYEVIGASKGAKNAMVFFQSPHRPTGSQMQQAVVNNALKRIGA
jgi:hypothetical protein